MAVVKLVDNADGRATFSQHFRRGLKAYNAYTSYQCSFVSFAESYWDS